jgi:hypothetical protein
MGAENDHSRNKNKKIKTISADILKCSEKVGDACLSRIITGDEICVHH